MPALATRLSDREPGSARLFVVTLAVSGALLFLVQPIVGRMLLPRFGGAPAVWNTAVVFFQVALLFGYAYAHVLSRTLGFRQQLLVHGVVLLLPLLSLPIVAAGWTPPSDRTPIPTLLGVLSISVGLPFFAVAATSPLLQRWFSRSAHPAATNPYSLYVASNVGSLVGLLVYPLGLEPVLSLRAQSLIWTGGYLILVALIVGCGVRTWRTVVSRSTIEAFRSRPPTFVTRLRWLALAFVPASLMLSVTLALTTDIAAVPLLWVVPIALYLVTFMLAFAARPPVRLERATRAMPLLVIALALVLISEATHPAWLLMIVHLSTFFVVALVCHLTLARERPDADRLTEFYLALSIGGVLGGVFNTLLAPLLFRSMAEYPLVLVLASLLRPAPATGKIAPNARPSAGDLVQPMVLAAFAFGAITLARRGSLDGTTTLAVAFGVPAIACYLFQFHPVRFGLGIAALFAAALARPSVQGDVLHVDRSVFGVHRITLDPTGAFVQLVHGNTVHGRQRRDGRSGEPLAYYHRSGPLGDVFALQELGIGAPIAVIGLGAGALASYAGPGQRVDFYEIDPVVAAIARDPQYFTFLSRSRGQVAVILGDARLTLERAPDHLYGVVVIDAFNSDSVPIHLLTREALEMYVRKLTDGGVLAFHVSNRYLDLVPVLAAGAGTLGLTGVSRHDLQRRRDDPQTGKEPSIWVVVSRDPAPVRTLADHHDWRPLNSRRPARVWTDDYANILGAFAWR